MFFVDLYKNHFSLPNNAKKNAKASALALSSNWFLNYYANQSVAAVVDDFLNRLPYLPPRV